MRNCLCLFLILLNFLPIASEASNATLTRALFAGRPALIILWRADCAPCLSELPFLPDLARAHPQLPIALVVLKDSVPSRFPPASLPANIKLFMQSGNTSSLFRELGDTRLALPYSVYLNKNGTSCARHYGMLGTQMLSDWVKRC